MSAHRTRMRTGEQEPSQQLTRSTAVRADSPDLLIQHVRCFTVPDKTGASRSPAKRRREVSPLVRTR